MSDNRNAAEWGGYLAALMPPGADLFDFAEGGVFWHAFQSLGAELERFDELAGQLLEELLPTTTTDLIEDWERMLALPRVCQTQPEGLGLRRALVVALLTRSPDLSPQMLIDALAVIGCTATILEGTGAGNLFKYTVTIDPDWGFVQEFEVGLSQAGDPLGTIEGADVDCLLDEIEPAYAERTLIFTP